MRTRRFSLDRHVGSRAETRVSSLDSTAAEDDVNVDTSVVDSVLRDTRRPDLSMGKAPTNLHRDVAPSAGGPRAMLAAGTLPLFLTVSEAADLLRTTRAAIYAMVERGQLPGVVRVRRRVLVNGTVLLEWLH